MDKIELLKKKLLKLKNNYLSKKNKEYEKINIYKLYEIYDNLNNILINGNPRSYSINDILEGGIVDNSKEGIKLQLKSLKEIIDNKDINEKNNKFNSCLVIIM